MMIIELRDTLYFISLAGAFKVSGKFQKSRTVSGVRARARGSVGWLGNPCPVCRGRESELPCEGQYRLNHDTDKS